jgi:aldose 1-epimerase
MGHPPIVLENDALEVVMLPEHGARLHRIRAFGVDLLRTPDDPASHGSEPFFWGAYVMAPWCNRARPGPMEVAGRTVDLAPNFPDGSAIHGQVYGSRWTAADDGWLTVSGGGDGWPWRYQVRLRPTLVGSTLELLCELTNRSDDPMPAGLGLHPWFRQPLEVRVPAETVYSRNTDSPDRPQAVDGTAFDLRTTSMPPGELDATWSSLTPPSVRLRWPDVAIEAELEIATRAAACLAVATPTDPDATAVEPQTHGPDGLRRLINGEPDALTMLAPGGTLGLALRLRVQRVAV